MSLYIVNQIAFPNMVDDLERNLKINLLKFLEQDYEFELDDIKNVTNCIQKSVKHPNFDPEHGIGWIVYALRNLMPDEDEDEMYGRFLDESKSEESSNTCSMDDIDSKLKSMV